MEIIFEGGRGKKKSAIYGLDAICCQKENQLFSLLYILLSPTQAFLFLNLLKNKIFYYKKKANPKTFNYLPQNYSSLHSSNLSKIYTKMKLILSLSAVLAIATTTTLAFTPTLTTISTRQQRLTSLFAVSAVPNDTAMSAIAAAAKASKEFGPTSSEARVAWEIVEELNSADNSAAMGGSLDEECEISDEAVSQACIDYGMKLDQLSELIQSNQQYVQNVKTLASDLKAIKLTVAKAKPAARSPAVSAALEYAKKTEIEFGKNSPEAKVAWAELEEVASSGLENAMGPVLNDGNCAIEASIEACEAIEEVARVLSTPN